MSSYDPRQQYSLEEETKPWLESNGKAEIQKSKPKTYEVGSSRLSVVYKSTTIEAPPNLPQIFAAVSAGSFHIVVGFALAYSAILIPQLEKEGSDLPISKEQAPWLASVLVLVVPVGALLAGFIMEYVGRLNTIKISAIPCLLGWFFIATATSFPAVLVGRLLTGVSAGMGTSPAIVYITEVAKPELRGALIATCPTLASLGMVLSYLGAYMHWRAAAWTSVIYVVIPLFFISIWIPESPVWLVARGRVDEAEKSLKWLAGEKSTLPEQQLAALVKSQDMKALVATGFFGRLSGFFRPSGYKPLLVLLGLFFFQQFSGVYVTLFYSIELFKDVGSSIDPELASILVGLMRLTMSFFNTALLSKFGRRPLIMMSALGMAACMITSGFATKYIFLDGVEGLSWLPVVCVLLYVCFSMLGLLSIPWTMTAELFPTEIRGLAHGLTISMAHILMFLSIQGYRDMKVLLGGAHGVQWFFAAMSLGAVVFVYVFLPETHGRKLIEIEQYFLKNAIYLGQKKEPSPRKENGVTNGGELVMISAKA